MPTATDPARLPGIARRRRTDHHAARPAGLRASTRRAEFLGRPLDWLTFPTAANGRPALICYLRRAGSPHYEALVVDVLRIENGKIVESNAFVGAHHVAAFGLPTSVEQPEP